MFKEEDMELFFLRKELMKNVDNALAGGTIWQIACHAFLGDQFKACQTMCICWQSVQSVSYC